MRLLHDSRDEAYRSPFGAVAMGAQVQLAIDVWDALGACVQLRTWFDGVGERLYDMSAQDVEGAEGDEPEGAPTRYCVQLTPDEPGIVWYQFIVTDPSGDQQRYGAASGCIGGAGQQLGWEPPSFQLTVFDPKGYEYPPPWYMPIDGYLCDPAGCHEPAEVVRALRENYPTAVCRTVAPDQLLDERGAGEVVGAADARAALQCARDGAFGCFAAADDVIGIWRRGEGDSMLCVLLNLSRHEMRDVPLAMAGEEVSELIGGYHVPVASVADARSAADAGDADAADAADAEDGADAAAAPQAQQAHDALLLARHLPQDARDDERYAVVHLHQRGSAILHFHARERLQRDMQAGFGVLAHITSMPPAEQPATDATPGLGTLGASCRAFVDWLAQAGVGYWQVLPANPTDEYGSPYAGISAFAGNTLLLEPPVPGASDEADADPDGYREFCEREAAWLEPYAAFTAIRRKVGAGVPWQEWPKRFLRFDLKTAQGTKQLRADAEACRREQFAFQCQWARLRAYANERGVQIVGDMPIYVSADSADVWAHPELFQLDADGQAERVAGCPPDAFAVNGQVWGNPVYDWEALQASGYDWWLRRLKRAFELYDVVRLDHFIGFSRYFAIPAGEKASAGEYRPGPGLRLFQLAHEQFGPLPLIAEDLGLITAAVRALVADCGFPGMDILQFVDGNDPLSGYAPRPEKIAYTGTHDNQTLLGYIRDRYPAVDEDEALDKLRKEVAACGAPVCVMPLQDLMGLGDEARMNVPGQAEGNWTWQAESAGIDAALDCTCELVELHRA